MRIGKSGFPLNVYKTEQGRWRADIRTAAGRRYLETFNTWRDALDFANSVFLTYEVPAVAPTHHALGFSEWKIRPGINIRTNHKAESIVLTAGKGRETITDIDQVVDLVKALLSAGLQIKIGGATDAQ